MKPILAALLLAVLSPFAAAAEIKVLSTNALTDVIGELQPKFEQRSGNKVAIEFKPTNLLMDRIRGGEQADVFILGRDALLALEKQGKIAAGTRADLAESSVALAMRAGAPKPDIGTPEAFKKTLLAAKAIATSRVGLSALHFNKVIEQLGIAGEIKPKVKIVDGGGRTAELIVKGEAELAVQLTSELLPVKGTQVIGPFPKGLDATIVLSGGVSSASREAAAAKAFLSFLLEPAAVPVLKEYGMQRPAK